MRQPISTPSRTSSRRAAALLALACLPAPFLVWEWILDLAAERERIAVGLQGQQRSMREATGIPDDELSSLRANLDERDRLLVFFPIDLEPHAAQPALVKMLEPRTQIYRNLLYPRPRDGRMCRSASEVARESSVPGAEDVVVVDLRQQGEDVPVDGATLVFERREGIRVRHWRLRGGGR
jgi:hypothetical protein